MKTTQDDVKYFTLYSFFSHICPSVCTARWIFWGRNERMSWLERGKL